MIHEAQSHATKPTVSLSDVGKKLGAAIAATPQYRAFPEAKQCYEGDANARELLGQYQSAQRTVQLIQQLRSDGAEEARKLEDLQKNIEANQTLAAYFDAQKKLIALLRELNEFISGQLNLDFAELAKPPRGCCG